MSEKIQNISAEEIGDVVIEPLTEYTLQAAGALEDETFSHVPGIRPSQSLAAYLDDEAYRLLYPERTDRKQFWVAKGGYEEIFGAIGLYEMKKDATEASYVGWFCVAPEARGRGLGLKLLQNVVDQARAEGKRFVRLDTAMHPKETEAVNLYQKMGFRIKNYGGKETGPDGIECQLIDMELEL